ncbi:MAG: hypothetical protein H6550_10250 [Chitinophagales bacterium]|nr:hypothetical protein [Chitinophagales bacterium]
MKRAGRINKEWHLAHPMPQNANTGQRIAWHLEHIKHCSCRGIPEKLLEEMKNRGIMIPADKK